MNSTVALIFFAVSAGLLFYAYLGFPVLLWLWSRGKKRLAPPLTEEPTVSMIVAAFNEEKAIAQKLENCAALDYPPDRIEFLIGSDASTDRTDSIVQASLDCRVKFFRFSPRSGKLGVLAQLTPHAQGEVLVFSDANSMYQPDAIRKLVRHFIDPRVGGVCGELRLEHSDGSTAESGEGLYWWYEIALKTMESAIHSCLGANGGIYALRRSLYRPIIGIEELRRRNFSVNLVDDFLMPVPAMEQGYRILYEPEALAFEDTPTKMKSQFRRKVKIASADFQSLAYFWRLLLPWRGTIALFLWSHKVLRWFAPVLLVTILVANILLIGLHPVFVGLLIAQLLLYGTALLGWVSETVFGKTIRWFKVPYYFVALNLSLAIGFFQAFRQKGTHAFQRTDREDAPPSPDQHS
jgi:biofilm PGA synthesis N-glycosyltransferase PgaC